MDQERQDARNQPLAPDLVSKQQADTSARNDLPSGEPSSQTGDTEEGYIELIGDALNQVDLSVQGAFLQKILKCLASVDVSEDDGLMHWQEILRRRKELISRLNRAVSLRAAAADYFGSAGLVRNPILLEYDHFKRLLHSAATDALTGFYNRRLFEDYLARELNRATRYRTPFALLLFDLRGFKKVNDTYGHLVGDEVLRSAARACNETIRGSDYPFRIGGDEFALLLPQSDSRSADSLANRIAQRFEQYAKSLAPGATIGLDYGVASSPTDGDNAKALFEVADRNLYMNKKKAYGQLGTPIQDMGEPHSVNQTALILTEGAEVMPEKAATATPAGPTTSPTGVETREEGAVEREHSRRHHERFPLEGTWSLGVVLAGPSPELVRILDISSGGVALLVDDSIKLPEKFQARLNVPLFSSQQLPLRRMYAYPTSSGKQRVGCSFEA